MANTTPSWRPMDGQLPITGAGLPLTAAFCPAPAGMLEHPAPVRRLLSRRGSWC